MKATNAENQGTAALLTKKAFEIDTLRAARRRYPRVAKNLIIGFRKMDSMEECNTAVTEDIGMGGFRINAAFFGNPLSANDIIEIIIKDPRRNIKPIIAIGHVAWIKEKSDNDYEIGVMLTNIARKYRKKFIQYLKAEIDLKC
ncbi:MAG: PilZ domain-containing protein [Candidatus Omnitrophica bacterium]|nr:PilZ domain-containing protein [Candidatus Omnitrophota bacterium]MBU4487906.1 PilZ domain-containing protein [Candidatus Omnitrophota bacterium]MCG2705505.1 PilZ domain-containing protein [Candidatus Omnitrophota bacterium]